MLLVDLDFNIEEDEELDFDTEEEEIELDILDDCIINNYKGTEVVNDHDKLINRELDNQHPISAITGLQEVLDEEDTEEMTMLDVIDLWNQL